MAELMQTSSMFQVGVVGWYSVKTCIDSCLASPAALNVITVLVGA